MDFKRLRREHRVLLDGAAELGTVSRSVQSRADADRAAQAIAGLDKLIVAHLRHEDRDLYGQLSEGADAALRAEAGDAYANMGGLGGAWVQFAAYWTPEVIAARPDAFDKAAASLLSALTMRIRYEEETLYPAAEKVMIADGGAER